MTGADVSLEALEAYAAGGTVEPAIRARIEASPDLCSRVERLRADNALFGELAQALPPPGAPPAGSGPAAPDPDLVPGYRLEAEIARGGQGIVYRGEQLATRRAVAVKTLVQGVFADDRARRRFEREAELVARLRHPNVVTVYDSGVTADGRHWLAMEWVDGEPLDGHAARRRAEAATPRQRDRRLARLFAEVAAGVQAAHRVGVMHRDLKPGNILVDATGTPRILDFGVARETRGASEEAAGPANLATQAGQFVGTIAYAAPEQLRGDPAAVDTRADVFALGVVMHEAITGVRPHADPPGLAEAIERQVGVAPPPPSRRVADLDADLDTIVAKCLALEPERRYASAGHLRDDLERFLRGEAIDARRDSRAYRARKFVARHRTAVAAAAGVALIVLSFAVVSTVQAVRLARRTQEYRQVSGSLLSMLGTAAFDEDWSEISWERVLDEAGRILDEELPADPAFETAARTQLALANLDRGRFDPAARQLEIAVPLLVELYGPNDLRVAAARHDLGRVRWAQGRTDEAAELYEAALLVRRRRLGDRHEDVARTLAHLGSCRRRQGRVAEATRLHEEALAMRLDLLGPHHEDVRNSQNSLALCLADQGRYVDAAERFEIVLASVRERFGATSLPVARVGHNLARCLVRLDRLVRADAVLAEVMAANAILWPSHDHPDFARPLTVLAELRRRQGRLAEAEMHLRAALAIQRPALPHDHPDLGRSLLELGFVLREQGRAATAEATFREAERILVAVLGPDHPDARAARAAVRSRTGDPDHDHG